MFCEDAARLASIREKYKILEDVAPDPIATQLNRTNEEVVAEAVKHLATKEIVTTGLRWGIDNFPELFSQQVNLQKFYISRAIGRDNYSYVDDEQEIIRVVNGDQRWDEFVTAKTFRREKKQDRYGFNSILFAPEYEEVYDLSLNVTMENAHQLFFIEPNLKIFRRCALEIVFVPGLFDCLVCWRISNQGLNDWDKFSGKFHSSRWAFKTLNWTQDTSYLFSALFTQLFKNANLSQEKTIDALREKFPDSVI